MPGPMPYYLEKGPILSVLEDYLNRGGQQGMIELLLHFRDSTRRVVECGAFDTPALTFTIPALAGSGDAPQKWTGAKVKHHINQHWFNDGGKHFWWNYEPGDTEGIMREGIVRALEVALGLDHGAGATTAELTSIARAEPWLVELFWKCGQNWVEAWLMWRKVATSGLVTVLLSTPSEKLGNDVVWMTPIAPDATSRSTPYELEPTTIGRAGDQGMFVVSHTTNVARQYGTGHPGGPVVASQIGDITPPPAGVTYVSSGPIVVVVPAEARGGVLPTRRSWRPAP